MTNALPATTYYRIIRQLRAIPMGDHGLVGDADVLVIVRPEGYDIGGDIFNREDEAAYEIGQYV